MRLTTLLPHLAGLRLDQIVAEPGGLTLVLAATRRTARCPVCQRRAHRVRSVYQRTLADLPTGGHPMTLRLRVRRFRCEHAACPRRIFAERFPRLTDVRARRTRAQRAHLVELGRAVGGRAGVRLARRLGLHVSRTTLLRLVRATAASPPPTPRVLGVDDWSRRRGRTYATILVDLERRQPIELLPDATAATLERWLTEHPGVEVVSRDRGGAYADGARRGAPDAIQVADRYHLSANAGETLERLLVRHHADLQAAAAAVTARQAGADPPPPVVDRPPTRVQREQAARQAHRHARFDAVLALLGAGASQREVAATLGLSRVTVAKYARAGTCPTPTSRRRTSAVDPYRPHLAARWAAGCRDSAALFQEIQALGFAGGRSTVADYLAAWRTGPRRRGPYAPGPTGEPPPPPPVRVPSPRQTRWLLLRAADDLKPEQRAYREELLATAPAIALGTQLIADFRRLVRGRDHAALAPWLAEARASGLKELTAFVAGIERDRAAVEQALLSAWSNGQTEGQITKLKLLKRSMYGRAGLELLKCRLLAA